mmetsp:Transcript_18199/g.23579  ORF Transcript_18199/g.23579 Transcript_18199/m.23579 type:complete len:614 (+) Transcript_18199:47-1888(+)
MKYVIVSGGVVSGLGKGITISSLGRLLQGCGLRVTAIKIDPYLNVDAGTMSPFEHGEVFVLKDGGEGDLDLGNYERFLNIQLTQDHNITTGKVYREVIARERRGDYLGKTVQVVPHITNEIQDWIERVAQVPVDGSGLVADVCLIEVGGTVGDIESMVFLEALRQFQFRAGNDNILTSFVSLVPVLGVVGEQKTKPTQHGVKELRSLGLSPSVIFCRSSEPLKKATKQKISGFCHVPVDNVLSVHDVNNIYHVPLLLMKQGLHLIIMKQLGLKVVEDKSLVDNSSNNINDLVKVHMPDLGTWSEMAHKVDNFDEKVTIALIGKYNGLSDSYLSVLKALKHSSIYCERDLDVVWVDATMLEENDNQAWSDLKRADGVIVPGGFGNRGFEGKMIAANYCRKNKVPYLGVCLGFQAMVIEFCRNATSDDMKPLLESKQDAPQAAKEYDTTKLLGWSSANSTEFDKSVSHPVVIFMPEIDKENMGGTMRLGARDTAISKFPDGTKSISETIYTSCPWFDVIKEEKVLRVSERHRHRYEVNPEFVEEISSHGLTFVGKDYETGSRMEIAELSRTIHPYYVGCQYHPEFLSRPQRPSPPFLGLLLAACSKLDDFLEKNS